MPLQSQLQDDSTDSWELWLGFPVRPLWRLYSTLGRAINYLSCLFGATEKAPELAMLFIYEQNQAKLYTRLPCQSHTLALLTQGCWLGFLLRCCGHWDCRVGYTDSQGLWLSSLGSRVGSCIQQWMRLWITFPAWVRTKNKPRGWQGSFWEANQAELYTRLPGWMEPMAWLCG